MALKATVYKATLHVADIDRGYYADHALTLACHPSETEERLMVRIITFALFASEDLAFTRGISSDEEPDIWRKDLTGQIETWIELGQPDEDRVRKACNRAQQVVIVTFGSRGAETWWTKIADKVARHDNLTVLHIPREACDRLAAMLDRSMDITVTVQDGNAFVSTAQANVEVQPETWHRPAA